MSQIRKYRSNGAVGALLDEYDKALRKISEIIKDLSLEKLIQVIDQNTKDEDCRSIQTILEHIIQSGYTYVIEIRKWLGESIDYKNKESFSTINEYNIALTQMFEYNEQLFQDYPNLVLEEKEVSNKIKVRWGQYYDIEQLFEHAIVHLLRHRRQIEIFKQQI